MKSSKSTDLTVGPVYRSILIFTLPILASHIFQNLYHSVDSIVVGNYVGTTALAAVSSCSDVTMLLTGFFTGLSSGAGVLFARYYGAKNNEKLHDSIHTAITFSLILGTAMALLGVILTPFLLKIVDCPADVLPEATSYLRIYFIGVLFTAIYNVASGVLRAVGDSLNPFIYLIIASAVNIVLDLVTVVKLDMGVTGVAIATIVSQLISVILVFRNLIRTDDVYRLVVKDMSIDPAILKEVISLGIPAAIQSSLISISNLFVQRYLNGFGSAAMAGTGSAKKVDKFIGMVGQSLGQATAPYVSQNIGAKNRDRVKRGIRAVFVMSAICLAFVTLIIYTSAESLIGLFSDDKEAIAYGVSMIKVMAPFYIFQVANQVYANIVRGYGKSRVVMFLSLIGMIGCRQLFIAVSMSINRSITNVFLGYPVGWFFGGMLVAIYYYSNARTLDEKVFGNRKGEKWIKSS